MPQFSRQMAILYSLMGWESFNYTGTYYIDNNFVYMKYSYTYDDGYGQGIKNGITTMVLKYMPELNEFWYPEGGDVIYK